MKSLVFGDLEQKVMKIIWSKNSPVAVADVLKELGGNHAYTTIMTVMSRMEKKGILKRVPQGKSFLYTPKQSKESYANCHLGSIYQTLVNTYGDIAISQFIDAIKNDSKNLKLLENYLDKNE